jgi:hypothetical protein
MMQLGPFSVPDLARGLDKVKFIDTDLLFHGEPEGSHPLARRQEKLITDPFRKSAMKPSVRRSQAIPKQWVIKRSEAEICVSGTALDPNHWLNTTPSKSGMTGGSLHLNVVGFMTKCTLKHWPFLRQHIKAAY